MSLRYFFNLQQKGPVDPVDPPNPVGSGFTYDEKDLKEWKFRLDNKVYWNWNDIPAEGNTIITRKDAFLNNKPSLYLGPTDNNQNGDGSWNGSGQIPPWSDDPHMDYDNQLHGDNKSMSFILNAAFYARVYNDEVLGKQVIERLVEQMQVSQLDYKSLPRFQVSDNGMFHLNPFFLMSEWLVSRAYAYDYAKIFANSTQKTIIENRLRDGAYWHKSLTDIVLLNKFFDSEAERNAGIWNREKTESYSVYQIKKTDDKGYIIPQSGLDYNNRSLANSGLSACVIGHIINDEGLKQHGWNMFREMFIFNIFFDGRSGDSERGATAAPTYFAAIMNNLSTMAYVAWKVDGNKAYFDFETTDGTNNHKGYRGTAGGPKGLKMFIKACSKYLRDPAKGGWSPQLTYGGLPINGYQYSGSFSGKWTYHHIYGASKANKYYKDPEIEDYFMMRQSAGYRGFEPKSQTAPSGHEHITKGVYNNCVDTAVKYFPKG